MKTFSLRLGFFMLLGLIAGRASAEVGDARHARASAAGSVAVGLNAAATNTPSTADQLHQRNLKAMGLSLILPGLAQLERGEKTRAAAFMVAEASIWTGFATFRIQGHLRRKSYIQMAQLYAGVAQPDGRSDDYYRLLGSWPSSDLYDEYMIATAGRALYPNDLPGRASYLASHGIPADEAWSWQSAAAWSRYQAKRSASEQAYHNASNMLGLALANRLVALLDATLFHRGREQAHDLHLEMAPGTEGPLSTEVRLRCSFR